MTLSFWKSSNGLERVSGEDKETLMNSDFNYNFKAPTQGADSKALKRIFHLHNFLQLIDCPKRITKLSATVIELIVTNNVRNIVKQAVVPLSLSDHHLVLCVTKINALKYVSKIIECQDYINYSHEQFCESLSQINWDPVKHASNVNNALDLFNDTFKEQCDRHAPLIKKKVRGINYPWLTPELKKLMQQRNCLLKKARRINKEENIDDSKSSWRTVKRGLPNDKKLKQSKSPIKVAGDLKTDKNPVAESFNHFFTSIVKTINEKLSKISCQRQQSSLQNTKATFTKENFELSLVRPNVRYSLLRKLKVNKATGLHNIPARLLQDGAPVISEYLTHIINLFFSSGVVLDDWKTSRVVLLFKSGNREEIDNYRPISTLPVISKIAEKVVYHQLFSYLNANNLLSSCQSGFQKNFSTETAVTFFVDEIRRNMDNGLLTGAVFIDVKKAFDTLDQHILLNKLQSDGICNSTLIWFSRYLLGRSQCVEVDKALSSPLDRASSVPQGSILGPLLFIFYINETPSCICFSQVLLCADDTVLFFTAKTAIELEASLNNDINHISSWMKENKLFWNMSKTEYVIYGSHQQLKREDSISLSCNGFSLTKSESFKHLGVVIHQHLSFNNHIEHVVNKVSRKLDVFRCLRISIPMAAAERLCETMILLVFDHCDVAWHGCDRNFGLALLDLELTCVTPTSKFAVTPGVQKPPAFMSNLASRLVTVDCRPVHTRNLAPAARSCNTLPEDIAMENLWLELIFQSQKELFWEPAIARRMTLSFWKSSNGLERVSGEDKETLMTSDFNYDFKAPTQGADLKALKRIFRLQNFLQLIDCPKSITKLSTTLIELIVTNDSRNTVKQAVVPLSLSDHYLVLCVGKINALKYVSKIIECRDYRNYSPEEFCESFNQINWDPVKHASDVNNALDLFNDIFKEKCDRHAPLIKTKVRGVNYPWLTRELKKSMQQRNCLLNKARRTNKEADWSAFRRSGNAYNNKVRSAKANYNRNLIQENIDDSKSFWRTLKRGLLNDKKLKQSMSPIKVAGDLKTDKNPITESFNHFFTSIVKTINEKLSKISCKRQQSCLQNTEATFTNENFELSLVRPNVVYNVLRKLKVKKATGLHNIPARLLQDGAPAISEYLTHLFFSSGVVPDDWKTARDVLLFKSSNREEMDNYRPVSILPVISKIAEKVVYHQLLSYLNANNLLSSCQSGFRKNFFTETAVTFFVDEIRRIMDNGLLTGAVFIDLKKAFDTLDHHILLNKLQRCGICNSTLLWFSSYLLGRTTKLSPRPWI
ncbi:RNA-directed DNA polymerase from mobile element jockey [Stylophora pistillata]|uniref:RNA-directed DNA polymerase from mobile element jockey n=1 Tax=Stylophora pistillata TaxID=50429 RepID=A0A2B4R6X4_STYPI|nr:RNA-directed DNA polymerase from mobile element jockey [Stylophora pistillata]